MELTRRLYNHDSPAGATRSDERLIIPNITPTLLADHSGERTPVKLYSDDNHGFRPYECHRPAFTERSSPLAE
ncbi:MAG: hypothetical protein Q7R87_04470 [Nanoarchaeota archaeon]|nr:hypothetical protein [Nanoarchaeota archaeon]